MNQATQQQDDLEQQQAELVEIIKRVDVGTADHDDAMALAAALGLTRYFTN